MCAHDLGLRQTARSFPSDRHLPSSLPARLSHLIQQWTTEQSKTASPCCLFVASMSAQTRSPVRQLLPAYAKHILPDLRLPNPRRACNAHPCAHFCSPTRRSRHGLDQRAQQSNYYPRRASARHALRVHHFVTNLRSSKFPFCPIFSQVIATYVDAAGDFQEAVRLGNADMMLGD